MANIILGDDPRCGIKKKILIGARTEYKEFPDGTKLKFLYQTRLCDDEHTTVDDSRKDPKPMELILGKKFKLEVWETCLKSMRVGEVASFTVDESLVASYPIVAKSLRDIRKGSGHAHRHCCGMTLQEHGLGYCDLDNLMRNPQPLEFILELISADEPGDYNKDSWAMDFDEKLDAVPKLREEGNKLFADKDYAAAAEKYAAALGHLEQLSLRAFLHFINRLPEKGLLIRRAYNSLSPSIIYIKEKPGDEEFIKIDMMRIPFLLNFSQCKLFLQDYYPVIEHTTEVLAKDPDNVKALFRRAKAHVGAWNPNEARQDFKRAAELDPSLTRSINKDLQNLDMMEKEKEKKDRELLQGKMF